MANKSRSGPESNRSWISRPCHSWLQMNKGWTYYRFISVENEAVKNDKFLRRVGDSF
jgi:hypothetical protein